MKRILGDRLFRLQKRDVVVAVDCVCCEIPRFLRTRDIIHSSSSCRSQLTGTKTTHKLVNPDHDLIQKRESTPAPSPSQIQKLARRRSEFRENLLLLLGSGTTRRKREPLLVKWRRRRNYKGCCWRDRKEEKTKG